MPNPSQPNTERFTLAANKLFETLPSLVAEKQTLAAICHVIALIHAAERGFLAPALLKSFLEQYAQYLPLFNPVEQIKCLERLLKIAEKNNLTELAGQLSTTLSQKHRTSIHAGDTGVTTVLAPPKPEHFSQQLTSLAYLLQARQRFLTLPPDKRQSHLADNNHALDQLEMEVSYDLTASLCDAQLKEYRRENADRIIDVLARIVAFGKQLKTAGFSQQAYTLYYQTLDALSMQQSFYENTVLSSLDEHMLLIGLSELVTQEQVKHATPQGTWYQTSQALEKTRGTVKQEVVAIRETLGGFHCHPTYVERIIKLQQRVTDLMKTFFSDTLQALNTHLGPPPCQYSLIALGSMARGDLTPYSDLESLLLVDTPVSKHSLDEQYFKTLWQLFTFQINTLGENTADNPGLHIDAECHPLLPGLLTTPENLAHQQGLTAIQTDEESEGRFALSLLQTTVVYAYEIPEQPNTLHARYQALVQEQWMKAEAPDSSILLCQAKGHAELERLHAYMETLAKPTPSTATLKRHFLGPLTYLCNALALYHQTTAPNLYDRLTQWSEQALFDTTFSDILKAAFAELHLYRLHRHLEARQAQEDFPKELSPQETARFERLWTGLIRPLYQQYYLLRQTQQALHPVLAPLAALDGRTDAELVSQAPAVLEPLIAYLLYTQHTENPTTQFIDAYHHLPLGLRPQFLARLNALSDWPLQRNTLEALKAQANPDGWQPHMEEEKEVWEKALRTLFDTASSSMSAASAPETVLAYWPTYHAATKTYQTKTRQLAPEIYQQLFDARGQLKTKPATQAGRHVVLQIKHRGQWFWFKFMPEQAGTEFAINRLERYLGGQGTPMSQIIKIKHAKESLGMAVQISAHVSGMTLESCLTHHPKNIAYIDVSSFTQTLLRVLLTNPEDDKGDDYFLLPIYGRFDCYQLIRIDNERAYYQPDAMQGRIKKSKQLQVKSMLYCLNQMAAALDHTTLTAFLRLDTFAVLERWIRELEQEQQYYSSLFNEDEIKKHFHSKHPGPSILGLPMAEGLTKELLTRLDSMQQVIRLSTREDRPVTGMDLLRVVQPLLATYYENAFKKHPISKTPDDTSPKAHAESTVKRFHFVTQGLYKVTAAGYRESTYSSIKAVSQSLRLKTELRENDVIAIAQGKHMGPLQALSELRTIQAASWEALKDALLREEKMSLAAFQQTPIRHQLILIEHIATDIAAGTLSLTENQQSHFLKAMAGTPFHSLTLSTFHTVLTDALLQPILAGAGKHLLVLDISQCYLLTERTFKFLAEQCPHVERLIVSNIKMDKRTWQLKDLTFPNLKTLIMNHCEPLTHLELQTPLLARLEACDCRQLQIISTGSLTLSYAQLSNNPALTESGLAHLSHYPHRLRQFNVSDCHQLSYSTFRMQFPFLSTQPLSLLPSHQMTILQEGLAQRFAEHHWTGETCPEEFKEKWGSFCDAWFTAFNMCITPSVCSRLRKYLKDSDETVRCAAAQALGQLGISNPTLAPQLTEPLLTALQDKGYDVPEVAALALKQLAIANPNLPPQLGKTLARILRNKHWWIREAATLALEQLATVSSSLASQLSEHLLAALRDKNEDVREAAAQVLGQLGASNPKLAPHLTEPLLTALRDKDSNVQQAAITALGQLGVNNPELAPQLIKPLSTALRSSLIAQSATAQALGELGASKLELIPQLTEPLLTALRDKNEDVREAVITALGQLGVNNPELAPQLIKPLLTTLQDKNKDVREAAAQVLGQLGASNPKLAPQLTESLVTALQDKKKQVRKTAAQALGQFGASNSDLAPQLTKPLVMALQDIDKEVRKAAAFALGYLGASNPFFAPQLSETLIVALQDTEEQVQKAAVQALKQLGANNPSLAPQLSETLIVALRDKNRTVREAAAQILGDLGANNSSLAPQLSKALITALREKELEIRCGAAAQALGQLATTNSNLALQISEVLTMALRDMAPWVRQAAAQALGELGTTSNLDLIPQLTEILAMALRDEDETVQQASAQALTALITVNPLHAPALIQHMLNDSNSQRGSIETRSNAIQGLYEIMKVLTIPNLLRSFDTAIKKQVSSFSDEVRATNVTGTAISPKSSKPVTTSKILALYGTASRQLGDKDITPFDFSRAETILLSRNNLSEKGIRKLYPRLIKNTSLKTLDLSHNPLGDVAAHTINKLMSQHTTLATLVLTNIDLSSLCAYFIATALLTNRVLTSLDLSYNHIGDNGMRTLAKALKIHPTLTTLRISGNGITETGGKVLFDIVQTNPRITTIELDNNAIPDNLLQLILQATEDNKARHSMLPSYEQHGFLRPSPTSSSSSSAATAAASPRLD